MSTSKSAGEAMPAEGHQDRPGIKDVVAWVFIGIFVGTLVWMVVSPWTYVDALGDFFGKLPLPLLVALAASQPSAFATIWLAHRYGQRVANRPGVRPAGRKR
jgi:hypothetical protein